MAENESYLDNYILMDALRDLYKPKPPERLEWVKPIEALVLDNFREIVYSLNSGTTPDFYTKIAENNHKQFFIPESYTLNILFRSFATGGINYLQDKIFKAKLKNQKVENSESFIYDEFITWINDESAKILKAYEKSSKKSTKHYIV